MEKIIFCNLDMLKVKLDKDDYAGYNFFNFDYEKLKEKRCEFIYKFKELSEESGNKVIFYSRKRVILKSFAEVFYKAGYVKFYFRERGTVEEFVRINKNRNNYFVFVGGKDADFQLAVNTHSLYIVPTWLPLEEKAQRYGVHVNTVEQLYMFIRM